jgi:HAD superfamily hydrolase (TIGR01549 family)
MIKSLIFDFGGTIDTNGVHWIEKFWSVYNKNLINISKDRFINAYISSERRMNEKIKHEDSFRTTLKNQLSLQFEYLNNNGIWKADEDKISAIAEECYSDVKKCIAQFTDLICKLEGKFYLAVVSNFYGNLETVLREFDILKFFEVIKDSTIVNIRKPDSKIFLSALKDLSVQPEETFVIGDSYENDIKPAQKIGCHTIWLLKKTYQESEETFHSDHKISSINQLLSVLNKRHILQKNNF